MISQVRWLVPSPFRNLPRIAGRGANCATRTVYRARRPSLGVLVVRHDHSV
jgi:hypothetical protein